MRVSVIIPLYRAKRFIKETIESVLSQNYDDFEIIVVDDCGEDGSVQIIERYQNDDKRIKIIHNAHNYGIAYSRNKGISVCSGEYIALLDDDDIMLPDRLKMQVDYLDKHPTIGAVGGNAQWIDESGEIIRDVINVVSDPLEIKMFLHFRNILNNSEMTFRKNIINQYDIKYSSNCYGMEDFKFWIDFSKVSQISNLPNLVLKKRMYGGNETTRTRQIFAEERRRKYLELQIYSLKRSGFDIMSTEETLLYKYMGEHHFECSNYQELSELVSLLGLLENEGKSKNADFYPNMVRWFHALISDQNDNVVRATGTYSDVGFWENKCKDLERIISDLINGQEWSKKHAEELEKYVAELEQGKGWLEKHTEELERYVAELEQGKEWLEKHAEAQERYISELLLKVKMEEKR